MSLMASGILRVNKNENQYRSDWEFEIWRNEKEEMFVKMTAGDMEHSFSYFYGKDEFPLDRAISFFSGFSPGGTIEWWYHYLKDTGLIPDGFVTLL